MLLRLLLNVKKNIILQNLMPMLVHKLLHIRIMTDINSLEDLKGKTVSGVLGSNNVKNLQNYDKKGEIKIRTYETRDGAMNDAINKRVDGYINCSFYSSC